MDIIQDFDVRSSFAVNEIKVMTFHIYAYGEHGKAVKVLDPGSRCLGFDSHSAGHV